MNYLIVTAQHVIIVAIEIAISHDQVAYNTDTDMLTPKLKQYSTAQIDTVTSLEVHPSCRREIDIPVSFLARCQRG